MVIGSGPNALEAADIPRSAFDSIVCINNAWRVRPDWDYSIFPDDFPESKRAGAGENQSLITPAQYLPAMTKAGGLPLCGATMAFAAGYWVLEELRPSVVAFIGCDMDYTPKAGKTHFYGIGTADPLRRNISLRDLGAKSGRLFLNGLRANALFVNLSSNPHSRLLFPKTSLRGTERAHRVPAPLMLAKTTWTSHGAALRALVLEKLAPREYTKCDEYWKFNGREDIQVVVDRIDVLWNRAARCAVEAYQPRLAFYGVGAVQSEVARS